MTEAVLAASSPGYDSLVEGLVAVSTPWSEVIAEVLDGNCIVRNTANIVGHTIVSVDLLNSRFSDCRNCLISTIPGTDLNVTPYDLIATVNICIMQ